MENPRLLSLANVSSNALTSSSPMEAKCDPRIAARLVANLLACYRASDVNNPEAFVAAATATLAEYPQDIAACVCNPVLGLPKTMKWLPSIAEIREACEHWMAPVYAERKREQRRKDPVLADNHRPSPAEHARVAGGLQRLGEALPPRADPRPKPFTLKLEEGQDAFASRGPPNLSSECLRKFTEAAQNPRNNSDDWKNHESV